MTDLDTFLKEAKECGIPERIIQRFWKKTKKTSGCWLWTGATDSAGYGQIAFSENGNRTILRTHRISVIISGRKIANNQCVDHLCMRKNCVNPNHLRVISRKQNNWHTKSRNGKRFKGVCFEKRRNSWIAQITCHGKYKYLGSYKTPELAATAYNNAAKKLFKEFAYLNIIPICDKIAGSE